MIPSRIEYYIQQEQTLAQQIKVLSRRSYAFIVGELLSFAFFLGFVAMYAQWFPTPWTFVGALFFLALYILIRKVDVNNSRHKDFLSSKQEVYSKEIAAWRGDFRGFGDGREYVDVHHAFTYDLDVFGECSLFNRMNRTVSSGGSDVLASYLSFAKIKNQSAAIAELSGHEQWRADFMALGQKERIDTDAVERCIEQVSCAEYSQRPLRTSSLMFVLLDLAGFYASVALSAMGKVESSFPIMWGVGQFFVLYLLLMKPFRRLMKDVGTLHEHLGKYVQMLSLVRELEFKDEFLQGHARTLSEAHESFRRLDKVLSALDSRSNILGLFLVDTFLMYDFFLLRKYLAWQNKYIDQAHEWIGCLSEIDCLVSMSTFRYNHPEAVTAEIVEADGVFYDARGIYHPFLGVGAVPNDFRICHQNHYIVTGANMAGKSTFLRCIGINYILALNGLPVFADSLKVSTFNLFSSMRTTDDLTRGISYFNAELLRLEQLMKNCLDHDCTLIILDEILKGTNSLDKLNGSRLFLETISKLPVSGIVATHDLELTEMSMENPGSFHNYCFEIELGNDVTYSYKITPGVAHNQNATFLLKQMLRKLQ